MRGQLQEMSGRAPTQPFTDPQRLAREENERARLSAVVPRFGGKAHPKLRQVQSERAGDWKAPADH